MQNMTGQETWKSPLHKEVDFEHIAKANIKTIDSLQNSVSSCFKILQGCLIHRSASLNISKHRSYDKVLINVEFRFQILFDFNQFF